MNKAFYECTECGSKYMMVYGEEGNEPTLCPFCGEEPVVESSEAEELFGDYA